LIPDYEQKILFTSFVRSFKINLQIVENDFGEKRLVSCDALIPEKKRDSTGFLSMQEERKKKERKKGRQKESNNMSNLRDS
jgi:hypothetical protein